MYRKDEPSALFHSLHHAHRRQVSEEQKRRGVSDLGNPMALVALLQATQQGQGIPQRELARLMRLSPATVAVSLKSMEKGGYVSRVTDQRDQRRNLVTLTEKGMVAVGLCGEGFRAVDEQMLSGFTPAEKEQLSGFLRRMIENLGGAGEPPFPPPPPPKGRCGKKPCKKERDRL